MAPEKDISPVRDESLNAPYTEEYLEELRIEIARLEQENTTLRSALEHFHELYEDAPEGFITTDAEGEILEANHTAARLLELDENMLPGKSFMDMVVEEDRDLYARNFDGFCRTGKPDQYELRLSRADDTSFWAKIRIKALIGEKTPFACQFAIVDISQYHNVVKILKESEERYRLVSGMTSDYVFRMTVTDDGDLVMDLVTEGFYRDTGRTLDDVQTPVTWEKVIYPADLPKLRGAIERILAEGGRAELDCRSFRKDGRIRWIQIIAQAQMDLSSSRVVGVVGSVTDISRRKLAEEALLERSAQLYNLGDNLPNAVVYQVTGELDGRRRFTYVGAGIERLNEITAQELLADPEALYGQMLPEHRIRVAKLEEKALATLTALNVEVQSRLPSGRLRWFKYASTPRRLDNGVVVWDGVEVDITDQKATEAELERRVAERTVALSTANMRLAHEVEEREAAQQALEDSERHLLEAQHVSHIGSWRLDLETDEAAWSREFYVIAGLDPNAPPPGLNESAKMFTSATWPALAQAMEEAVHGGPAYEVLAEMLRPDGEVRQVICRGQAEEDQRGKVKSLFGTVQDVTEWMKAEAERKRLELQVQHMQKMESLGILAGGIAHDFNNILQIILANVNLMHRIVPDSSKAHPHLENIERSVTRAAALTRQMLAYSGQGYVSLQTMDIGVVVGEIVNLLRSSIPKRVAVELDLAENLPLVHIDPAQVQQVVMNLVLNASESLDEERGGTVAVSIRFLYCGRDLLRGNRTLEEVPEGVYVCVEVADTGRGMTEEMITRLFDPFYTTKFTGRGLGMSAVLGIIRSHKGAILVDSSPGQGTTICILFPATDAQSVPQGENVQASLTAGTSHSGTILFVDDETDMLEISALELRGLGYRVLTAADGVEAVNQVKSYPGDIDCVLLDLNMPRKDGKETLVELRRLRPGLRVVLMSGYTEEEVEARFAGQDIDGFLEKPYTSESLSEILLKILG